MQTMEGQVQIKCLKEDTFLLIYRERTEMQARIFRGSQALQVSTI